MTQLLIRPANPDEHGRVHHVTPESAGWGYVGFDLFTLTPGQVLVRPTEDREACLVLVAGVAEISGGGIAFGRVGGRKTPFDGAPHSVYVPARGEWRVVAETACELAVCTAPAEGRLPARSIGPEDVTEEIRGTTTNLRRVRNVLPDTSPHAENLLVVEVVTPGGHWSSYPPHKHDTDDFPNETYLEETYYHRLARSNGFALQRVYTDDGALDVTMAVHDRDVVLVPRGYHPVAASHGFDLYYLNVMAGPVRAWKFTMSPDHAHLGWTTTREVSS